jgi:hypothetical protein
MYMAWNFPFEVVVVDDTESSVSRRYSAKHYFGRGCWLSTIPVLMPLGIQLGIQMSTDLTHWWVLWKLKWNFRRWPTKAAMRESF